MQSAHNFAVFGEHVVPGTGDYGPCSTNFATGLPWPVDADSGDEKNYCQLQCDIGYSAPGAPAGQEQIFWVHCDGTGSLLYELGSDSDIPAGNLNCQPDECISTSDEEEAKKDTHILCSDSHITSGTTGACKCTAEDPTPQTTQAAETTQTTQTTTSSAVSLRSEYAQMLLFSLSFLV